jgi:hypothetical protein
MLLAMFPPCFRLIPLPANKAHSNKQKQRYKMQLQLVRIVKTAKQRSYVDNRRMVNAVTAEYRGEDGNAYRKTFESYGEPIVPTFGDNIALTAKRIQWTA